MTYYKIQKQDKIGHRFPSKKHNFERNYTISNKADDHFQGNCPFFEIV